MMDLGAVPQLEECEFFFHLFITDYEWKIGNFSTWLWIRRSYFWSNAIVQIVSTFSILYLNFPLLSKRLFFRRVGNSKFRRKLKYKTFHRRAFASFKSTAVHCFQQFNSISVSYEESYMIIYAEMYSSFMVAPFGWVFGVKRKRKYTQLHRLWFDETYTNTTHTKLMANSCLFMSMNMVRWNYQP